MDGSVFFTEKRRNLRRALELSISSTFARLRSPRPSSMSTAVPRSPRTVIIFFIVAVFLLSAARSEEQGLVNSDSGPCPVLKFGGDLCPVNCFRPDPVCGENGVTYWCGCSEAACAGVRVAKNGYCEVGNGGSGLVSGQAFLLIHILWLIILGFSILCGFL